MRKSLKQKIVSSLLAVSLAVSLAPIGQVKADSTSEITQTPPITKQVDANRAIEHIRFLSETIGPRPGETKSEEWASRNVGMKLKSMGYEVEYQPFQVPDQYVRFIESLLGTKQLASRCCSKCTNFYRGCYSSAYLCSRWYKIGRYSK